MKKIVFLTGFFVLAALMQSWAQTCPFYTNNLIIRTGYDYSNSGMLPSGTDDQFWIVKEDNVASTNEPRTIHVQTLSLSPSIGACNGLVGGLNGSYISAPPPNIPTHTVAIEYKFCLNQVNNVNLNLSFLADDLVDVYLNGNLIGSGAASPISNISINNQSFFVAGNNTIRFVVTDVQLANTWLQVDGTLTSGGNNIFFPGCNALNTSLVFNETSYSLNSIPQVFDVCVNQNFNLGITSSNTSIAWEWDFGDASIKNGLSTNHAYTAPGLYTVKVYPLTSGCFIFDPITIKVNVTTCPIPTCDKCIGSFAPTPGEYIISCWVKEDRPMPVDVYNFSGVKVYFNGNSTVFGPFFPSFGDKIINGWQRIEARFTVPAGAIDLKIALVNTSGASSTPYDSYFDDIRVYPVDGNMKSYVYDPITLRLVAELDENNFATLYEYDEEGKLIRVKKETEKGIMTIKETKSSNKKQ